MSYSDDETEKKLKALEAKLRKEYRKAYEEMKIRADQYFADYKERWETEYQAYQEGKYTDAEWYQWEQAQLGRGERFENMRDDLAQRMADTNKMASAYINDATPSIYSLNNNYQAYQIGGGIHGVDFTMYDEQTIKGLMEEKNFSEFKTVSTNPKRDYSWNQKQIQSALTSGILQGKSIDKIADSFMVVMKRNRQSAVRNARTAFTSAQNGGRLTGLKQAQAQGIDVKKKWLAIHDGNARMSHAILDGQTREIDKKFDNGLMFPADPDGSPAEVYNCRCTLTYVYPKFDDDTSKEMYKDKSLAGETYQQFVKRMTKEATGNATTAEKTQDPKNKNGQSVTFSLSEKGKNYEEANARIVKDINELTGQYKTFLTSVTSGGAPKSAGTMGLDGSMNLSNKLPETYLHEFGHSLSSRDRVKTGLADADEIEFMKDAKSLYREYKKACDSNYIENYISSYSLHSVDEFIAEGFALAQLEKRGYKIPFQYGSTKYASKLMDLVDKHLSR